MTNTALLIIDVQNGLLAEPEKVHDPEGVLARIGAMVTRARDADVPVMFVQHDGCEEGHPLKKPLDGWKIHPGTGYRDGDEVVEKRDCDAFQNTKLQLLLDSSEVRHLVVAGMCSEYCIDTTVRRAYSLGYDVTLVSDAHTTISKDYLNADMIVRHHNAILGSGFAKGQPADAIDFRN